MPQETTPASPASPTAVIPGTRSSVNLGPDYDHSAPEFPMTLASATGTCQVWLI